MESDLLLASPRSLVRVASARLAALAGLALAAVAAASSRSPAASTALLEQLASPTAVPTASPTPRAQRFDAIDDDNASSCYAYETAQYGVAACNATDTAFCESVRKAHGGAWPELLKFAGCDRCDGAFGICLMRAVANLDALCANWTHASADHYDPRRRLGSCPDLAKGACQTSGACEWHASSSACIPVADAPSAAPTAPPTALSCPDLAKGACQTSGACEWHSSSSACIPVVVAPSAAPTSAAPSAEPTIPAPSASPTYLELSAYPDCDIHAYCAWCAPYAACADLMSRAHRGNITGVERQAYSSHGYHAAQAAEIIQKLPLVCPRAPGGARRHR